MTTLNVQFSDSTQETIQAYFCGPQDSAAYANMGTITTTDARWATYYASLPSGVQRALPAPNS